ncbi:hypothetical protein [Limnoglobus roseus]|uniref:Uncharacterized protein n=1 Tax=Limnoglobus roseus TaxID=2598579 RepID=A0A5C1AF94_9BACT|nr:hypothetical protein [Limnoglobus roseus]QEL16392.1 hypothetical protein PX52LOC_03345 [Limnoglobus roseus]
MDEPLNAVVTFRTSRSRTASYLALSAILFTLACASWMSETEGNLGPCVAVFALFAGWIIVWSTLRVAAAARSVTRDSLLVVTLFHFRRYAWVDLNSWGTSVIDIDTGRRGVWFKFNGRFFSLDFHESDFARPGFDRFLELLRQYVGDKERPT